MKTQRVREHDELAKKRRARDEIAQGYATADWVRHGDRRESGARVPSDATYDAFHRPDYRLQDARDSVAKDIPEICGTCGKAPRSCRCPTALPRRRRPDTLTPFQGHIVGIFLWGEKYLTACQLFGESVGASWRGDPMLANMFLTRLEMAILAEHELSSYTRIAAFASVYEDRPVTKNSATSALREAVKKFGCANRLELRAKVLKGLGDMATGLVTQTKRVSPLETPEGRFIFHVLSKAVA